MVIEEREDEDEPLDLLDKKALESRITLVKQKSQQQGGRDKKRKLGAELEDGDEQAGPFRVNKEGKLLITDLDAHRAKRKKKSNREENKTPNDENDDDEDEHLEEEEEN